MSDLRNPFRLRAANRLEREDTFVSLFAPGILSVLDEDALAGPPLVIRSAPGGGKTSLLRLFTPSALWAAERRRDIDSDLYQCLQGINALHEGRPRVLGLMLAVGRDVAALDDLPLEQVTRRRLLFAILTARITIEAIRSAAHISAAEPVPLEELTCLGPAVEPGIAGLQFPCSGLEVFQWASDQEETIGSALDTYPLPTNFPGYDSLSIIRALDASRILLRDSPVAECTLVMLDDLQNLATAQRRALLEDVSTSRYTTPIWLTERLAALDEQQLLDVGALPERDFSTTVLEDKWASQKAAYRQALNDVASRRAKMSTVADIPDFSPCLEDRLIPLYETSATAKLGDHWLKWYRKYRDGTDRRSRNVILEVLGSDFHVDGWDSLIKLRSTAILVARDKAKSQSTFEFAADTSIDSDVRGAAELFLSREGAIPYYYGFERLAILSSGNIEQFLGLAGDMFERLAAKALSRRTPSLTAAEQDAIVHAASDRKLEGLSQYVALASDVRRLLTSIGKACAERTFLPNAPYSPGVTGVGIRHREWQRLRTEDYPIKGATLLRTVLHSAISNNLLEISQPQRCKSDSWIIVRLNRILCPIFSLPLHRSQWRPTTARELVGWIEKEYMPTQPRIDGL